MKAEELEDNLQPGNQCYLFLVEAATASKVGCAI